MEARVTPKAKGWKPLVVKTSPKLDPDLWLHIQLEILLHLSLVEKGYLFTCGGLPQIALLVNVAEVRNEKHGKPRILKAARLIIECLHDLRRRATSISVYRCTPQDYEVLRDNLAIVMPWFATLTRAEIWAAIQTVETRSQEIKANASAKA